MFSSIKAKLLFWDFIIFSLIFLTLGLFLYKNIESVLIDSIDDHLHSEIQIIAGLMGMDSDEHGAELTEAAVGEFALPLSGHYYQLTDNEGKIIARSPSLSIVGASLVIKSPSIVALFETTTGPGKEPLRAMTQTFTLPTGRVTIQAGESLEETYLIINKFKRVIFISFPLFWLLVSTGLALITGHSFKKINAFSDKLEQITEKKLDERVEVEGVESELLPLSTSFNRMMDRLEDSFERQKRFLSDASHDLRTPTSVIKSQCEITLTRERSTEEYTEALESIEKKADHMRVIINKILEVARFESDAFHLKLVDTDLFKLLYDVRTLLLPKAEIRNITIETSLDSLRLKVDRDSLFEAFSGLLENAINYNKDGGKVEISLKKEGPYAVIAFSDTGLGINGSKMEKIFDRFYRADESRGVVEGSGLGLSIVKVIIEGHGGRIEVRSRVGEGSCFTVILPLA